MELYSKHISKLIEQLGRLPGIGPKSAQRLAFHIIGLPEGQVKELADSITEAKANVHYCRECGTLTDQELCPICANPRRNHRQIMVVENSRDLRLVCVLMDIRHAPMESDIDCYQWLLSLGLPILVILTKSDKLSKGAVITQTALYKKTFGLDDDHLITYTSTAHTNRRELIQRIMAQLDR